MSTFRDTNADNTLEKSTTPGYDSTSRSQEQRLRIIVSGGGTGGHIYPALAVATDIERRYGATILYIGDADGLETQLVPKAGIKLETIHAGKFLRYWSRETVEGLVRVPRGFIEARKLVRAFAPQAVFTSGGYVAVPVGIAARRLNVPVLIHQQDVLPNLANRLLSPFATSISVSFDESLVHFPKAKTQLTGNPVRDEIVKLAGSDLRVHKRSLDFSPAFPLLVVTGGSQGARHINEAVVAALPSLLERFQILHISGQRTYSETFEASQPQLQPLTEHVRARYRLVPYLEKEMPIALAAADAVIARAGAATLAELAILGKPSILVPLPPGFSGSPQESNAAMFQANGSALVVHDQDLTALTLVAAIDDLFAAPQTRINMALSVRTLAHPEATKELADAVVGLAQTYTEERKRRAVMQAIQKASR